MMYAHKFFHDTVEEYDSDFVQRGFEFFVKDLLTLTQYDLERSGYFDGIRDAIDGSLVDGFYLKDGTRDPGYSKDRWVSLPSLEDVAGFDFIREWRFKDRFDRPFVARYVSFRTSARSDEPLVNIFVDESV